MTLLKCKIMPQLGILTWIQISNFLTKTRNGNLFQRNPTKLMQLKKSNEQTPYMLQRNAQTACNKLHHPFISSRSSFRGVTTTPYLPRILIPRHQSMLRGSKYSHCLGGNTTLYRIGPTQARSRSRTSTRATYPRLCNASPTEY